MCGDGKNLTSPECDLDVFHRVHNDNNSKTQLEQLFFHFSNMEFFFVLHDKFNAREMSEEKSLEDGIIFHKKYEKEMYLRLNYEEDLS